MTGLVAKMLVWATATGLASQGSTVGVVRPVEPVIAATIDTAIINTVTIDTAYNRRDLQLEPGSVNVMAEFQKPSDATLRAKLSPTQYRVTQHGDTERPFENEFWDNEQPGIYVDVVSGEVLFSSSDQFNSACGWPSFDKPLEPANIDLHTDRSLGMDRTEVRSNRADSHLGHVFNDGPTPTGLRYCMNSAAMHFIPFEDLELEGYGQYSRLFEDLERED